MNQYLSIAEKLLEVEQRPMTPKEMAELAHSRKMLSDKLTGKTPHQTLKAALSRHVRKLGDQSVFVRTDPGYFYLRKLISNPDEVYYARALTPRPSKEDVLVFPSHWLDEQGRFQGITKSWRRLTKLLLNSDVCIYKNRLEAEQDESYKQVIIYVLVTRQHEALAFRRGSFNRVQDYLRGSQCIGFGGHIALSDWSIFDREHMGVFQCASRELSEELKLPKADLQRLNSLEGLKVIGLLNDDSSPEGRKHFAIIMRYEVSKDPAWDTPTKGEKSVNQLRWLDITLPGLPIWDFEYWSQLCLRTFFHTQVRTQPDFLIRRKEPLRSPHLLCVLGEIGSGKSETTKVLKEEFGYLEVNSGRVMADLLKIAPIPETPRDVFQDKAWAFIRSSDGPTQLAEAIWSHIQEYWHQLGVDKFPRILIDGIRQEATLKELKRLAGHQRFGILYVHTPPDVAYEFYKERLGGISSIYDFLRLRENPVEQQVREMIGLSDAVLYNWVGRTAYRNTIHKLMQAINALGH